MTKKITSDGINTSIEYNGVKEVISDGNYSAQTKNVNKTHSVSGIEETGSQRNVDIKGNSQETCYTRGVTCEANIKVVGNPDQFDGTNYRKVHKALGELAGIVVQQGDDKQSLDFPSFPSIDFGRVLENMSSSYPATTPPPTPHISNLLDAGLFVAEIGAWYAGYISADAAELALRAGKLEIERQIMQSYENIKTQGEKAIEAIENLDFSALFGGTATEDKDKEISYNIDRKTLYTSVNSEYITELEKNL